MKFSNLASLDPVLQLRGIKSWEAAGPFLRYDAIWGGLCAVCGRFFTRMVRIFAGCDSNFVRKDSSCAMKALVVRDETLVVRDARLVVRDARLVLRDEIALMRDETLPMRDETLLMRDETAPSPEVRADAFRAWGGCCLVGGFVLHEVLGEAEWRAMLRGMSKYAGEEVLVVSRDLLNEIGAFEGIRTADLDAAVQRLLDPANHFFMDRAEAENDPGHKQLIPYCVFRCGDRILHYTRGKAGGESRLHAKISVGVGGHVNPVDTGNGRTGAAAYHAAVTREIEEELDLPEAHEHRIIGLLNDETNPVGQVHLGIVHLVDLKSDAVASREDALTDLGFTALTDLNGAWFERLETWSQFCIRHLAELK